MEIQHHGGVGNSKVVKIQSEEAWDLFTDQASKESRPEGDSMAAIGVGGLPRAAPCECVTSSDEQLLFLTWFSDRQSVVAHFGASWCVTSLSMNYKFEELAQTNPEVLFLYVDVDDVQSVSSKYGVKAMPTFFLIKNTEVVRKIVGANPDEVKKLVDASAEPFQAQIVVE